MGKPDGAMLGTPKYERVENDFYPTEAPATEAVVRFMQAKGLLQVHSDVREPTCGDGAIVRVLEKHGYDVLASDLYPQMDGALVKDFLTDPFDYRPGKGAMVLIMNPPYAMPWINQFMDRCNDLAHNDNVVSTMLMRNEVDAASSRRIYFEDSPYYLGKLVLTWRPRWVPGSTGSPRHNYAWYFWGPSGYRGNGEPFIRYASKK